MAQERDSLGLVDPFAFYDAQSSSSIFFVVVAQTAKLCDFFEQGWRGGLNPPLTVNFGGAISR